jgi:hypothetical protein
MQLIQDYSKRILDDTFEVGDFNYRKFSVKCSRLRQGFRRAIICQDDSPWTVTLIQSNPAKVVNACTKVMVYLDNHMLHLHITSQVRRDRNGLRLLFFDRPDGRGRPTIMVLEA